MSDDIAIKTAKAEIVKILNNLEISSGRSVEVLSIGEFDISFFSEQDVTILRNINIELSKSKKYRWSI